MKNKKLEQIMNLIVDYDALAKSVEEKNHIHNIYLDAQYLYKKVTGDYYPKEKIDRGSMRYRRRVWEGKK